MRIHSPLITGSAANTNIILTTVTASISVLSSSFAATASYWSGSIVNAASASYWSGSIVNAATASYVLQAQSASYWSGSIQNATSASYALTASYAANVPETASYALQANSASFALTASYISGSGGGVGFPFSGSAIITGSLFVSGSTISGSFKGDGSQITGLAAGGKIHTQSSAASTWTVTHNLGVQYPNVTVYNSSNEIIIPQTITATDTNTLTLTFGSAVAGYAIAGIGGIINVQGRTTQQYFTAATTWSFAHNLGDKYVSLQAFDDAFEMVIPTTIRLVDATSSLLLFDSASSGYAVATIGGDLPAISSSYAGYTLQVANSAPYSASWVSIANTVVTTAQTASYANNFTVNGTLTAQTINVQTITSSIEFVTGSTRNGSITGNTHQFTGSVLMSGSLNVGSSITANQFISNATNVGDEYYFFKGNSAVSNNFTAYSYSNTVYLNAYNSLYLRANNTGGSGGNIVLSGGNVGIGSSTSPVYKLEVSTAGGSERIRVGTLQNNGNTATFEAITTAAVNTASSAWFRANAGGTLTIGTSAYTKANGDSGNFANLSSEVSNTAMSITSGGSVLLGTSTERGRLAVSGSASSSVPVFWIEQGGVAPYAFLSGCDSYHGVVFRGYPSVAGDYSVTAGDYMSFIEYGGEFRFYKKQPGLLTQQVRFTDGTIYASNTSVQSISDIRTKENITNSEQGLDIIDALRPVRFDFKEEFNEGKKNQLGFIAQEIEEIFPDAVGEWKDDNDGITYKTVGPGALIPVLVKAIQELSAKVAALENK